MSGIVLALAGATSAPSVPTVIGEAFGGGYYGGQIGVSGVATHYLIIGPKSTSDTGTRQYKNAATATTGADSDIDGPQNTADMVADGNATVYPAAHFCNDLSTGGQTDWYMPAQNELDVFYFNLKPSTALNNTFVTSGINPNAIPPRATAYTQFVPAQTSVTNFQAGGAEAFNTAVYWSSTELTATNARAQYFTNSAWYSVVKNSSERVRAIRRIPV